MEFLVITGLSGAGKTIIHDVLEDMGYYCVDNLPQSLLGSFYELCAQAQNIEKAAVVIDCRSFVLFDDFYASIEALKTMSGNSVKMLFADCDTDTLLRRFKEKRRTHPLAEKYNGSTTAAVEAERALLEKAKKQADYTVDTSDLTAAQLKEKIKQFFVQSGDGMKIEVVSFGFKHGLMRDADLQFDVRCFPNPYYVEELRPLTGLDAPVRDYVMGSGETVTFIEKLCDMVDYLVPLYIKEGKSQLVIAVGCTGGHHRSVAIAECLAAFLRGKKYNVAVTHRDKDIK